MPPSGYAPRASSPRAKELRYIDDAYKHPPSYAYDQPPLGHTPQGSLCPAVTPIGGALPEAPLQTNFGEELRPRPVQPRDSDGHVRVSGGFFNGGAYQMNPQAAAARAWQTQPSEFIDHCQCFPDQTNMSLRSGQNGLPSYGASEEFWLNGTMGSITQAANPGHYPPVGTNGNSTLPSSTCALRPMSHSPLANSVYNPRTDTHPSYIVDEPADLVHAGTNGCVPLTLGIDGEMANANRAFGPTPLVPRGLDIVDGRVTGNRTSGETSDFARLNSPVHQTFNDAASSAQVTMNDLFNANVGLDSQTGIQPSFFLPLDMQTDGVSVFNGSADHSYSVPASESLPYNSPSSIATSSAADTPSAMPTDLPHQVNRPTVSTDGRMRGAERRRTSHANVVCPIPSCGTALTRNSHLKDHIQAHEDKREYLCPIEHCEKGFNTFGNLRSHLKHIHKLRVRKGANGLPVYTHI